MRSVYLHYWYNNTNTDTEGGRVEGERDEERARGRKVAAERDTVAAGTLFTQFTCVTGTKVQILTQ